MKPYVSSRSWTDRNVGAQPSHLNGPAILITIHALAVALAIAFAAATGWAQTTTSSADGWVVLPVGEYTALRHAAFPAEKEAAAPAVEATLSRLDYELKVDGDLASGEARLTVDVIREGWVWLPLPEGLMVREAKLDGREVSLVTQASDKGPNNAQLLLSKTGRADPDAQDCRAGYHRGWHRYSAAAGEQFGHLARHSRVDPPGH